MVFNIKKFLTENKLTGQSQMREDDNTNLIMPTGDDEETFDDEEETDDWNRPEPDDSAEFEKEPTAKDVKPDASALGLHKKQIQLQSLEDQKDVLLMQLKSNIITLDQYKEKIGNIPQQIKKLRADLDQAMNVTADDDSEDEAI